MPRCSKRSYGARKGYRRNNKRLIKKIRNVVSASTGTLVQYPRSDPRPFKADRPWKRTIRYVPGATETAVNYKQIIDREATFYSGSTARWQGIKILCLTVYGNVGDALTVTYGGTGDDLIGQTLYTDLGDGTHRPCVKMILPPTSSAMSATNSTNVIAFNAGTVSMIDAYVELN